jgi:hypothetical protein
MKGGERQFMIRIELYGSEVDQMNTALPLLALASSW